MSQYVAGRPRVGQPSAADRLARHEYVAFRAYDMALAQSVRLVDRAGKDDMAPVAGQCFDPVRVRAIDAYFDACAACLRTGYHPAHRIVGIGMIGVQHEDRAENLDHT